MPHLLLRSWLLLQLRSLRQSIVQPQRSIDTLLSTTLILGVFTLNPASGSWANAFEDTDTIAASEQSELGQANIKAAAESIESLPSDLEITTDTETLGISLLEPDESLLLPTATANTPELTLERIPSSAVLTLNSETLRWANATENGVRLSLTEQSEPGDDDADTIAQADPSEGSEDGLPNPDEPLPPTAPAGDRPILTPEILNSIMEGSNAGTPPEFDVYRLGPGDGIFVSVQRFPDLSFQATLDLQGNVIVPIEGAINLEGFTLAQAEARVRQIYDQYVVNPDVDLTLTAQRPVEVTILGEVVRPGFYPLPAPQVSTALLASGGATGFADLRSVQIRRQLPDGQIIETEVDLFTPLAQGDAIPDLRLENGDVMTIPRLDLSELDEYDRYLISRSTLAREAITIRTLNYAGGGGINTDFAAFDLPNGSRLLDAVTAADVNPDNANFRQVALIRFDPVEGRAVTMRFDMFAALEGDLSQNPPLENNDVVIANRNFINRITYALNTFTQPFRDTLGFLLFFDSLGDAADDLFRP